MIGNQHAEDLRRCCDAQAAEIKRLREVLGWTAGALQALCNDNISEGSTTTIAGETKRFGEILDMADAALGRAALQGENHHGSV